MFSGLNFTYNNDRLLLCRKPRKIEAASIGLEEDESEKKWSGTGAEFKNNA